jgi:hypothetical protein
MTLPSPHRGKRVLASALALLVFGGGAAAAPVAGSASVSSTQDDCGTGGDAASNANFASFLDLDVACSGALPSGDPTDYYAFPAYFGDRIDVSLTRSGAYTTRACLVNPAFETVACTFVTGSTSTLGVDVGMSGDWKLSVYLPQLGDVTYQMTVTRTLGVDEDCWTGGDAGDDAANASLLLVPVTRCEPVFHASDAADWYRVPAGPGQPVRVDLLSDHFSSASVCLQAPGASAPACDTLGASSSVTLQGVSPSGGDWLLQVVPTGGEGRYTLSVDVNRHEGRFNDRPVLRNLDCRLAAPSSLSVRCVLAAADDTSELYYYVDWGDGAQSATWFTPGVTQVVDHAYAAAGAYVVGVMLEDREGGKLLPYSDRSYTARVVLEPGGAGDVLRRVDGRLVAAPEKRALDPDDDRPGLVEDAFATETGRAWLPLARRTTGPETLKVTTTGAAPGRLCASAFDSQLRPLPMPACAAQALGVASALPVGTRFVSLAPVEGILVDFSAEVRV